MVAVGTAPRDGGTEDAQDYCPPSAGEIRERPSSGLLLLEDVRSNSGIWNHTMHFCLIRATERNKRSAISRLMGRERGNPRNSQSSATGGCA